jgi:hypothetical protein
MLQDIPNGFECVCKKCGAKFESYYYTHGLIDHMNETDNRTLEIHLSNKTMKKHYNQSSNKGKKHIDIWLKEKNLDIRTIK